MVARWFCVRCYHLCVSASRRFPRRSTLWPQVVDSNKGFELLYPHVPTKEPVERVRVQTYLLPSQVARLEQIKEEATSLDVGAGR